LTAIHSGATAIVVVVVAVVLHSLRRLMPSIKELIIEDSKKRLFSSR